ncbi:MAG: hypothetical protein AAGG02_21310, partial [Cyanobacteria bacterium P01_H01_bin.15]
SLRATATTRLVESGRSETAITMRTDHKDCNNLRSYQQNQGLESKAQQGIIFGGLKRDANSITTVEKAGASN